MSIQGVATELIPVAITVIPFLLARREARARFTTAALVLMIVWIILGAASIGWFYVPSVIALGFAADRQSRQEYGPG